MAAVGAGAGLTFLQKILDRFSECLAAEPGCRGDSVPGATRLTLRDDRGAVGEWKTGDSISRHQRGKREP